MLQEQKVVEFSGDTVLRRSLIHYSCRCLLVCCVALLPACVGTQGVNGALSMKGYELYSWPAGEDWDFALMVGTNRFKTLEEIKSPQQTLHGAEAVKTALRGLPTNEQVFWEGSGWLQRSGAAPGSIAIASAPIRDEIANLCSQLGITLTVDD